jgi:hypothetical protein
MVERKRHGWLVGALQDAGYQQRDLARAWKVDDAVVSRFITSGKPDLTPERQMMLAQMLGITNDQLLSKLYGDIPVRRIIPLRPDNDQRAPALAPVPPPSQRSMPPQPITNSEGPELELTTDVQREIRRAVDRLQQLLPDAVVNITLTYEKRS